MLSLMLIFRNFDWRYEERIDRGPACSGFVRVTGRLGSKGASSLTRWLKSYTAATALRRLPYLRFTLSYRDVEDLLAKRGLDISYEPIRTRVLKFGALIARRLGRRSGVFGWDCTAGVLARSGR